MGTINAAFGLCQDRPAEEALETAASLIGRPVNIAPQVLREKVARGEQGRKSGRGFFDWSRTS